MLSWKILLQHHIFQKVKEKGKQLLFSFFLRENWFRHLESDMSLP